MSVWRYVAVPIDGAASERPKRGEIASESASAARQALRRIGLQVVDLRPARRPSTGARPGFVDAWRSHLRGRRGAARAEIYDGLATMLDSGLPLVEALDTALRGLPARSARRAMLVQMREDVRSGASLADAMGDQPAWFDAAEVAMVAAGQHGGHLSRVLGTLAERHQRADALAQRLTAALTYPAIVAVVGLGVVVFLGTRTLPEFARVLGDAGVEVPALTLRVIAVGEFLEANGVALLGVTLVGLAALAFARATVVRSGRALPPWVDALRPRVTRRLAIAQFAGRLADLVRCGVPLVQSMRVLAPTISQLGLRRRVLDAADQLEQGHELASALKDETWFDPEFRRLLDVGQASGELDVLLERIGERYARQSARLIDRLTALLEPAVILVLAFLVGLVVVAAVLPMIRMQEIL